MAFVQLKWEDNVTKLNATNMNHIEDGVAEAIKGNSDAVTTANLYTDTKIAEAITTALTTPV